MNPRVSIPTVTLVLALTADACLHASTDQATDLIQFGASVSAAPAGKIIGSQRDQSSVIETAEGIKISTTDSKTLIVQFDQISGLDLSRLQPTDFFTMTVRGTPNAASLRIVMAAGGWAQSATWLFDLSGIKPDRFTTIKAQTAVAAPARKKTEAPLSAIGSIQLYTPSESSVPLELEIRSLGIASK